MWSLHLLCLPVLFLAAECFPQNSLVNGDRCDLICNSEDHESYRPQACHRECPGYQKTVAPERVTDDRINDLQEQISVLQTRYDSLLVIIIFLALVILVVVPLMIIYRDKILNRMNPFCCSSEYRRKMAKKKQVKRNRSQRAYNNAPTNRPRDFTNSNPAAVGQSTPAANEGRDSGVSNSSSNSQGVIGMNELKRQNEQSVMSPNPQEPQTTPGGRLRHPSESSCAEGTTSGFNDCSFGDKVVTGYYNDAMSVSSPGLSNSRTPVTLSAANLLKQNQSFDSSQDDSTANEGEVTTPNQININFAPWDNRRPSSPDSVILSNNIISNATVATNLSVSNL